MHLLKSKMIQEEMSFLDVKKLVQGEPLRLKEKFIVEEVCRKLINNQILANYQLVMHKKDEILEGVLQLIGPYTLFSEQEECYCEQEQE